MKDLKQKQDVLQAIMKMCDSHEMSPLAELDKKKKSALVVEVEPEQEEQPEDSPMSMTDKVAALVAGKKDEESAEDMDDDMKSKLMELYAKLADK